MVGVTTVDDTETEPRESTISGLELRTVDIDSVFGLFVWVVAVGIGRFAAADLSPAALLASFAILVLVPLTLSLVATLHYLVF